MKPRTRHLHVGAGENWHQSCSLRWTTTCRHGESWRSSQLRWFLAPTYGIGAYGVELQRLRLRDCVGELETGKAILRVCPRRNAVFGYRDSIFKMNIRIALRSSRAGLAFVKQWQPVLTYENLTCLDENGHHMQQVFDAAYAICAPKIADPKE